MNRYHGGATLADRELPFTSNCWIIRYARGAEEVKYRMFDFMENFDDQPREESPMRKPLTTLATLTLITATLAVHPTHGGNQEEKEKQSSIWMKQKRPASQEILKSLADSSTVSRA